MLAVASAPAHASSTQEALFQDEAVLVRQPSDDGVAGALDALRSLGVTRVKATIFWRAIAPAEESRARPSFAAGDPAAYPAVRWGPFDRLVRLATARGLAVDFNISSPVPAWATRPTSVSGWVRQYLPSAREFALFVKAVGIRYSGRYVVPQAPPTSSPPPPSASPPPSLLPPIHLGGSATRAVAASEAAATNAIPRVSFWSIWNEPNGWFFLAPQYTRGGAVASAPVYRSLVDAAFRGLAASGHGRDTILIGETAPLGRPPPGGNSVSPLRFTRALYCVGSTMRPLRGAAARALGCPTRKPRSRFPRAHPGLFSATGWATHPYALRTPPDRALADRDAVGPADVARVGRTLRGIFGSYGRGSGPPIYLTEFGYESNPPDPSGFSPARQAAYINQSEFQAYRNGRVRSYAQFLLIDTRPLTSFPPSHPFYWSSFQTGLVGYDGRPKPALDAYRLPLFIPNARSPHAAAFRVWGAIRPAAVLGPQAARLEFRPRGGRFQTLRRVTTGNPRGYFDLRVILRRSGDLRTVWTDPTTRRTHLSRSAAVSVG